MPAKIIQLNFGYSFSGTEFAGMIETLAKEFAQVQGLRWIVWMNNEAESEAGGIYLFDDQTSLDEFMNGPLAAQLTSHPSLSDFRVKQFDIMDELAGSIRGPIEKEILKKG